LQAGVTIGQARTALQETPIVGSAAAAPVKKYWASTRLPDGEKLLGLIQPSEAGLGRSRQPGNITGQRLEIAEVEDRY
jgi:hypothetical protein